MSLEFSNLPLEEVVIRAAFAEPQDISFAQYAEIWNRLSPSFATATESDRIDMGPAAQLQLEAGRLTAVSFQREDLELKVQRNLIVARWRRDMGHAYPRYRALRSALDLAFTAISEVLGPTGPNIHIVNMTYTNLIVGVASAEDGPGIARYLSRDLLVPRMSGKMLHSLDLAWRESPDMDLRVGLQRASISAPVVLGDGSSGAEERPAIRLSTTAGGIVAPPASPLQMLDNVHDTLQRSFITMVTPEAQEEWGYAGRDMPA